MAVDIAGLRKLSSKPRVDLAGLQGLSQSSAVKAPMPALKVDVAGLQKLASDRLQPDLEPPGFLAAADFARKWVRPDQGSPEALAVAEQDAAEIWGDQPLRTAAMPQTARVSAPGVFRLTGAGMDS